MDVCWQRVAEHECGRVCIKERCHNPPIFEEKLIVLLKAELCSTLMWQEANLKLYIFIVLPHPRES